MCISVMFHTRHLLHTIKHTHLTLLLAHRGIVSLLADPFFFEKAGIASP